MNKPNQTKNKHKDIEIRVVVTRREEDWGQNEMGKGGQLYGLKWEGNLKKKGCTYTCN